MFEGHPFRDAPARKLLSTRIRPRVSRRARFAGFAVVAVFWNSISWWLMGKALGAGHVGSVVLMAVFVIVGAMILGATVHALLAVYSPVVEIFVGAEQPALGDTLEVQWRLTGKTSRVRRLQIDLEGIEEATHTRGTTPTTDRERFVSRSVATIGDPRAIAEGTTTVVIPRKSVPSFTADHNKIVWCLVVRGVIPRWPDINEEFVIDVVARSRRDRAKVAA